MYNDYLSTKRLMCNVKMCQVVKSSTLCICIHILYQKDEGMQESIATYLTEVYQMQIKNP